jgi:hypothetical protein
MIHLLEMKILFLSKRRPQGKDLLTRPYGRFFHIPRILAESGHDVTLLVLSYKGDPPLRLSKDGLILMSESLFPSGPFAYVLKAKRLVEQVKPDWIVGFSDTYYGILAVKLAERFRTNAVIDAYDNYESYIPWLKPIHILWRKDLTLQNTCELRDRGCLCTWSRWRQIPLASRRWISMNAGVILTFPLIES